MRCLLFTAIVYHTTPPPRTSFGYPSETGRYSILCDFSRADSRQPSSITHHYSALFACKYRVNHVKTSQIVVVDERVCYQGGDMGTGWFFAINKKSSLSPYPLLHLHLS